MRSFLLAALALVAFEPAMAKTITVSGDFTASAWRQIFGLQPAAPIDPLSLAYSVTFDTTLTYNNTPNGLTLLTPDFPYSVSFSYTPGNDNFALATRAVTGGCIVSPNHFCAFVEDFSSGLPSTVFQGVEGGAWSADSIIDNSRIIAPVPEPASWAMLITGFGLAGAVLRRRRTALAA